MSDGQIVKNAVLSIDSAFGENLVLRSFSGIERLSELFSFQLDLISEQSDLDFDEIIGSEVTIGAESPEGIPRFWNGIISRFSQVESGQHVFRYQAELVPALWFLTRQADCRIFPDANVQEIVEDIFEREGRKGYLDPQLTATPRKREYCVQYRETTCNFIMRLLEQEGIYFFFTHTKNSHKMVIADSPVKYPNCQNAPILYVPSTHSGPLENSIQTWEVRQEIRSGNYVLRDFNFKDSTSTLLTGTAASKTGGNAQLELYDYPGEFETHEEGATLAGYYMDAEESPHKIVTGMGTNRTLAAGSKFRLAQHPVAEQNAEYVLTSVNHRASESVGISGGANLPTRYENTFTCIPSSVAFRPLRSSPKPLIVGPQTAIIVAKQGEEILTDKFGRVKVRFHWDRETQRKDKPIPDEQRSCFMRVSQPWAGQQWGAMWLPRAGQEVIVEFLEGDPDRPIITGRVYNDKNMPPWDLPAGQTQSGFKSHSSPKGTKQNFNMVRFEDKKGHECLEIHAEQTMLEGVEGSQFITVGGSRHVTTGGEKDGATHGDTKELVFKNRNLHVKGDSRTQIDGKSSDVVTGDEVHSTTGGYYLTSPKSVYINAPEIFLDAGTKITLQAGGSFIVLEAAGVTVVGTMVKLNPAAAVPPVAPVMPLTDAAEDP